ncbi:hypothetical protein [Delftia sp. CH05]|uniref:hypothetical protein n=1 Tax=Delftia sp. CH05 TaxID=2692194 RepID=UPI00135E9939|nr:hypothetical protein [Delftia sp. CH05]MXN31054.1 hypothetical protein [Delftia sp. CH05]
MTDIVTIPDVLPISPYPALGSTNFNNEAYAYATSVPPAVSRMREIAVACRTCAIAAQEYAQTAQAAASTATSQADAAMGYRNAAQNAATAAASSASTASTHASNAVGAYTQMQALYLGAKTSNPVKDNQGNALQLGAWYTYVGTDPDLKGVWLWWDGTDWNPGIGAVISTLMPKSGGTFAGPINVPPGATGFQAPPANEVTSRTATGFDHTAAMSAAPLNQWATYISATGVGSDWPPGHTSVNAWDVITFGESGRVTQIASQAFSGIPENAGAMFVRTRHDAAWGAWSRMITDRTMMDREKTANVPAGTTTYAIDPREGSVHYVSINGPVTFSLPAQGRQLGDQVTLRVYSAGGVRPITIPSNSQPPVGQTLPNYAANQIVTIVFFYGRQNIWDCFYSGVHQG